MYEYEALAKLQTGQNVTTRLKIRPQCHNVRHKSHMNWTGVESGLPWIHTGN